MKSRIALAQINPTVGDITGNRDKIIEYIDKAKLSSVDIVVFPEMVLCGSPLEDLACKPHFIRDNLKALKSLAKGVVGIAAVIGFIAEDRAGRARSAAAVVKNGQIEKVYFPGEEEVFSLGDSKCAINITNEISVFEEDISCNKTRSNADIIFNLCGFPYAIGERKKIIEYFSKRSSALNQFNCFINLVGGQDGLVFDGGSFIAGPDGKLAVSGKRFTEDIVFFDAECREKGDTASLEETNKLDEIHQALVLGTRDYLRKNGFEKCVLGLSGGLDSALTAVIARDAVGADNVMAISMPSQFSSEGTQQDSKKTAESLGITLREVPIKNICDIYHSNIDQVFGAEDKGVAGENLQARVRGNILMAFSNKFGWLVLTTGNKSESAVGYCTLYGDMAGGFAVIGDLLKTTAYKLARYINNKEGREVIPESVISRAPSAELSPGQKDTDSLPSYDVLDPILKAYIEEHLSFDEINARLGDTALLKKVINMVDRTEYKRIQAPPGVKLTHWVLGRDRVLPITNKYTESDD